MTKYKIPPQLFINNGKPDKSKIDPIQNEFFIPKAKGGLWTSSFIGPHGSDWVQWCLSEQCFIPPSGTWESWLLYPIQDLNILTIDTYDDLKNAQKQYPLDFLSTEMQQMKIEDQKRFIRIFQPLDFERLQLHYHGIHLTKEGQWKTRYTHPSLYGWDCETYFWFNWYFERIKPLGMRRFKLQR